MTQWRVDMWGSYADNEGRKRMESWRASDGIAGKYFLIGNPMGYALRIERTGLSVSGGVVAGHAGALIIRRIYADESLVALMRETSMWKP